MWQWVLDGWTSQPEGFLLKHNSVFHWGDHFAIFNLIISAAIRVSTENRKSKIFEIFDVRKYFEPFEKNLRNFEFSRNFRRKFFGFVRKFSTKISKIFENLFEKIKNAQNRLIRWENRKKIFHFEPKIVEKILVAVNIRDAS